MPDTFSPIEAAKLLGVSKNTVWRMARKWYGQTPHHLTPVDLMVGRAWVALNTGGESGQMGANRILLDCAESIIRRDPKPWLLISDAGMVTFHSAELAAAFWLDHPAPVAHLIRLDGGDE
jgi:hypothetical protein